MKFGKVFVSQMVPEWQEAYIDYNYLKSLLKDIEVFKQQNKQTPTPRNLRRSTFGRAFSGLIQRTISKNSSSSTTNGGGDIEDQVILVNMVKPKDSGGRYETMFLMSADEGGENELAFFRKLDSEFNKVNKFYTTKVEEVMQEAASLSKQMDALIAFRFKVKHNGRRSDLSAEMNRLALDVAASAAAVSASAPSGARASGKLHVEVTDEDDTSSETNSSCPDEVLNHVKMNNTMDTPYATIKGMLKVEKGKEMSYRRTAEACIR